MLVRHRVRRKTEIEMPLYLVRVNQISESSMNYPYHGRLSLPARATCKTSTSSRNPLDFGIDPGRLTDEQRWFRQSSGNMLPASWRNVSPLCK